MKALLALLLLLSAAVLFRMTIAEAHPEWLRSVGLDWGGLADAKEWLVVQQGRRVELAEVFAQTLGRCEKRIQIVQELVAGRLDFFTAAAQFQELNRLCPATEKLLAYRYPGKSAGERACRHLLEWMKEESFDKPDWTACREVHARLEAELEHHLLTQGDVHLP
jgi:hypothetical protein